MEYVLEVIQLEELFEVSSNVNENANINALDLISLIMTYISVENYGQNVDQNHKLDVISLDIENRLTRIEDAIREVKDSVSGLYRQDSRK